MPPARPWLAWGSFFASAGEVRERERGEEAPRGRIDREVMRRFVALRIEVHRHVHDLVAVAVEDSDRVRPVVRHVRRPRPLDPHIGAGSRRRARRLLLLAAPASAKRRYNGGVRVLDVAFAASALTLAFLYTPPEARAYGRFPKAQSIVLPAGGDGSVIFLRATFGILVSRDMGKTWHWLCEQALGFSSTWDPPLAATRDGRLWVGLTDGAHATLDGCAVEDVPSLKGETLTGSHGRWKRRSRAGRELATRQAGVRVGERRGRSFPPRVPRAAGAGSVGFASIRSRLPPRGRRAST